MNPQDPLAQLRNLASPDAVTFWPPAPGWWLLAILLCVSLVLLIRKMKKRRVARAYRKEAMSELETHWQQFLASKDALLYLQTLAEILKRTALSGFPATGAASASGEKWLSFLDSSLPAKHALEPFQSELGQMLISAPYRKNCEVDPQKVHEISLNWIRHHKAGDQKLA